jgi:hypothetical protein
MTPDVAYLVLILFFALSAITVGIRNSRRTKREIRRVFEKDAPDNVRFREAGVQGRSTHSGGFLTRHGAWLHNVIVSAHELWIWPQGGHQWIGGGDAGPVLQRVSLENVRSVSVKSGPFKQSVVIEFEDAGGERRGVQLWPSSVEKLLRVLPPISSDNSDPLLRSSAEP